MLKLRSKIKFKKKNYFRKKVFFPLLLLSDHQPLAPFIYLLYTMVIHYDDISNWDLWIVQALLLLVPISSTFYAQLLRSQIPKAQKIQSSCQSLFLLLGSAQVKAVRKMLVKSTPSLSLSLCVCVCVFVWCGWKLYAGIS